MPIVDCVQRTPEWIAARLGRPTASNFGNIVKFENGRFKPRTGQKMREDYKYKLVAERLAHESMFDAYESKWMKRGSWYEKDARLAFSTAYNVELKEVGFFESTDGRVGCSPDAMTLDERGLVEIKVPAPWTHLEYLLAGHGEDYIAQVLGQLWITGCDFAWFWSYQPGDVWNGHQKWPAYPVKTYRSEHLIEQLAGLVMAFCDEVDDAEGAAIQKGCRRLEAAE
jgi:hypothetical protein